MDSGFNQRSNAPLAHFKQVSEEDFERYMAGEDISKKADTATAAAKVGGRRKSHRRNKHRQRRNTRRRRQ